jgi:peptide chain release factor 2/peptide chain release factor
MTDIDLVISSGVGPIEARRFAVQLAVRLERLAEQRGLEVREVIASGDRHRDSNRDGNRDAPRSITLRLAGDGFTQLADELGTHVLIHRADRRGRASRKRWFVAVSAHPVTAGDAPGDLAAIPRDALVITACRAGGPGGQHVNKVASAVRVHHVPSGLVIRCAAERSQRANLDRALRRLAAILRARAETRRAADQATRRDVHHQLERGRPVRTYQLDHDGVLVVRNPS